MQMILILWARKTDSPFNRQNGHAYGGRVVAIWDAEIILLNLNDSVCVCLFVCVVGRGAVMSDSL